MHYGTMIFGKSLKFTIDLCSVDPLKRIEKTMEKNHVCCLSKPFGSEALEFATEALKADGKMRILIFRIFFWKSQKKDWMYEYQPDDQKRIKTVPLN